MSKSFPRAVGKASVRLHENEAGEDTAVSNMATFQEGKIIGPVLLTENDIPGASLEGRKPAELKKADLLFWLQCRGDSAGLKYRSHFTGQHTGHHAKDK